MTTTDVVPPRPARVATHDDLLALLDDVVAAGPRGERSAPAGAQAWHEMLTRPGHPLATDRPDECLPDWAGRGLLPDLRGARVRDAGCGGGRNAAWFARQGATVVGIDLCGPLLDAARPTMPAGVTLLTCDVLRGDLPDGPFDVVHDSGCYHHVAPHRRATYRERVLLLLAPGGRFGIVTLDADACPQPDDATVVRSGDTAGGASFSRADPVHAFAPLVELDGRAARPGDPGLFAEPFLRVALFAAPA